MKRRILELTLYLASPLALVVTSPLLAQGLGPADRGELGIAQAIAALLVSCGSLGQAEVFLSSRDGSGYRRNAAVAWASSLVAGLLGCFLFLAAGLPWLAALAALALTPPQSQIALWRAFSVRLGRTHSPALANASSAVMRVLFVGALWIFGALTTSSAYVAVQAAVVVGSAIWLGFFAFTKSRTRQAPMQSTSYLALGAMGAPLLLFNLLTAITMNANLFFLQGRVSAQELGAFAAAASLSLTVLSVSGAFRTRVQASLFAKGRMRQFNREMQLAAGVAIIGAIVGFLLSPVLVALLLGPGYESAVWPMRILSIAAGALLIMDCCHGAMAIVMTRRSLTAVAAAGTSTLATTSLLLVGPFGAVGGAIATLSAYSVVAVLGWIAVHRKLANEGEIVIEK